MSQSTNNHPLRIAISGIAGSFSEEAARKYLDEADMDAEIVYAVSARGTFETVTGGSAEYGLVPLENSNGGIVLETVYAMADFTWHIERILEIDVQQNLIAAPGVKRDKITAVVSHHQALAQCKFYLRSDFPDTPLEEYADTALAARDLAEGKLPRTTAVIASRAAAELYHLPILEPGIQDLKFNFTSFMAISPHR
jgi:prephenate dehydratase